MNAMAVEQPVSIMPSKNASLNSSCTQSNNNVKMVCFHPKCNLSDGHGCDNPKDFLRGLVRNTIPAKDICDFTIAEKSKYVELMYSILYRTWLIIVRRNDEWIEVASYKNSIAGKEEEIADIILNYMDTDALVRLADYESTVWPIYLYEGAKRLLSAGEWRFYGRHKKKASMLVGWIYTGYNRFTSFEKFTSEINRCNRCLRAKM